MQNSEPEIKAVSIFNRFKQKVQDKVLQRKENLVYSYEERLIEMGRLQLQAEKSQEPQQKIKLLRVALNLGHPLYFKGASQLIRDKNDLLLEQLLVEQYYLDQKNVLETIANLTQNNPTVLYQAYITSTTIKQKLEILQQFNINKNPHAKESDAFNFLSEKLKEIPKLRNNKRIFSCMRILQFGGYMFTLFMSIFMRKRLQKLPQMYRVRIFSCLMGVILIPFVYQLCWKQI